ncbi:MAG: DeoR/GlpR transcriptional regulator [Calditrichae bacterium]|nr:DeoR/GlpR transcriptional regulator [Calditrichia bacterium]
MLAKERQSKIIDMMNTDGRVTVDELSQIFDVSTVTIRNDLDILSRNGMLQRIHGGAVRKKFSHLDLPIFEKQKYHTEEKEQIGKRAAELVEDNETIIIDSGTTTQFVAKHLANKKNITVITHAINIAYELAPYPQIEVILTGGVLRNNSYSLVGPHAEEFIKSFYVHKFFLGLDGFDLAFGLSTQNVMEAKLNALMAQNAQRVIAVCDSSKFHRRGFAQIIAADKLHAIVTDKKVPDDIRQWATKNQIELLIA